MLSKEFKQEEIGHDDDGQGLQKSVTWVSTVFEVESILLQFTQAVMTYHKNPSLRKAQHMDMRDHVVPFWKTKTPWK